MVFFKRLCFLFGFVFVCQGQDPIVDINAEYSTDGFASIWNRVPTYWVVEGGLDMITDKKDLRIRTWGSKAFRVALYTPIHIKKGLFIMPGLAVWANRFEFRVPSERFIENGFYTEKNNRWFVGDAQDGQELNLQKGRLTLSVIGIPLDIKYMRRGSARPRNLQIAIGGYVGAVLGASHKMVYTLNSERTKAKDNKVKNLKRYQYGIQARIGYRFMHIFYRQVLSSIYTDGVNLGARYGTFGLGVSF